MGTNTSGPRELTLLVHVDADGHAASAVTYEVVERVESGCCSASGGRDALGGMLVLMPASLCARRSRVKKRRSRVSG